MHGYCCPCIVFSSVLPSRGPLLRPDAGSEIFSRQTPHGSPQTRRTERKFRMPPRLSGSSFRNSGNERERPYRLPQPAESDGCTSSSQSKKSVVAAFRKFSPLTATDLRHAPKSHLPAAVSSARKSAMGPSTVRPLFHMRKHISERNTETGHEPERKRPRPKPLRTASYRLGGRPPQNDVAPSGSAADRRKSRRRPHSATTHPPAGRAENSPRRKAGARSIRREKRGHPPPHVYRRKATPYPGIPNGHLPLPPDVLRSRSVRPRTGCGRERVQSGNAACGCASGYSNPKNAIGHVDPSKHILSVFPCDGLVSSYSIVRQSGAGNLADTP